MDEITGWLLDLYEDGEHGLALWVITDQDQRICLHQSFPVRFFAVGPSPRLRALWRWLQARPEAPHLAREERRNLFIPDPIPALAVEVKTPAAIFPLFKEIEQCFPELDYYDVDIKVQVRHAAAYGSFPLARCRFLVDSHLVIQDLQVLDSPWEIAPDPPPLRVLEINLPDGDPRHARPDHLELRYQSKKQKMPFLAGDAPAFWVKSALRKYDPDILVTDFGDTWLLQTLIRSVRHDYDQLPLNRDPTRAIQIIREKTYFSYGQIVYRGQQIHLAGRIHIDRHNAMMWNDYELEGVLENARVTALPIQTAARVSPGTGISCMQMTTALRDGVLVPWHKQQVEEPRPMIDLIHADFGGLVYQPIIGLHRNVAAIDFVSLYPAVMVRCNISPEKMAMSLSDPQPEDPGLIPQTLAPLLMKRVALKKALSELPDWDPRRKQYKVRAAAQKWLLVVCFGYLGYKNARFGLIGSHEAVTAGGREALLRAKEAAEDMGFLVLHLFVDALWIQRKDCTTSADFQPLLDEVTQRTGLPIALDGMYRWIAFLPSKLNSRVPVGNRYFGVFTDGEVKVRGLAARRRDTPPWVAETQMALLEYLAQAPDANDLQEYLPGAFNLLRQALRCLWAGQIKPEELLVTQRLTRILEKYKTPSPAARAAMQLHTAGSDPQPGQRIRFIHTYGKPDVWAWDRPQPFDVQLINIEIYRKLLLRAAADVFQPFGISPQNLALIIEDNIAKVPLFPDKRIKQPWELPGLLAYNPNPI